MTPERKLLESLVSSDGLSRDIAFLFPTLTSRKNFKVPQNKEKGFTYKGVVFPSFWSRDNPESLGEFMNSYWIFNVPFAFRDALDIKHTDKKIVRNQNIIHSFKQWTQGNEINFKQGDVIYRRDRKVALQVKDGSTPSQWNDNSQQVDYGIVNFAVLGEDGQEIERRALDQLAFVDFLVYGDASS